MWKWAKLSEEQLGFLQEAERTLGAGILLAYQASEAAGGAASEPGLKASRLNESQVDCLRGTENRLNAVIVAYQ
jgi:hypothetical protein